MSSLDKEWESPTSLSPDDQYQQGLITKDQEEDEIQDDFLMEQGDGPEPPDYDEEEGRGTGPDRYPSVLRDSHGRAVDVS